MNAPIQTSAEEQDKQSYYAVSDASTQELLAYAAKKSNQSVMQIMRDYKSLNATVGKINLVEYVRHRFHMPGIHDDASKRSFISNDLHWPITHTCNEEDWATVAEDKMLAEMMMKAGGVAVPETVAVIDTSPRVYPGTPKISTADELRDIVLKDLGNGLFGKIVHGMVSFGAFRIDHADATHLTCTGKDPMTYAAFMADFVGDSAYMLQRKLVNHPEFSQYCDSVATVRMVNLLKDGSVFVPMATIKLPQGENIADAFWRPGNIACAVEVAAGTIKTVTRRDDPVINFMDDHPEVSGLMGMTLPCWDEVIDLNARAAKLFARIRYQSTDIAITPRGPVIVELNYGGAFDLPQYTNGKGLLTPEIRSFFEEYGYDFSGKTAKKPGLFGRLLNR